MGLVYRIPMVELCRYAKGRESETAAEDLAEASEVWDGRIFILLKPLEQSETSSLFTGAGQVLAAHEVLLERPVLWHLGER